MERVALDMDTDKAAVQEFEGRVKAIVSSITTETTLTKEELRKLDGNQYSRYLSFQSVALAIGPGPVYRHWHVACISSCQCLP